MVVLSSYKSRRCISLVKSNNTKIDALEDKISSIVHKASQAGASDDVRFNLTLSNPDNRRLEYLRRRARMTKQDFVTEILLAAMEDIEERLGLTVEGIPGLLTAEYADVITSKKPIASLIRDLDD